jgi:hypothetical protein
LPSDHPLGKKTRIQNRFDHTKWKMQQDLKSIW